jgi:hypothetical protein
MGAANALAAFRRWAGRIPGASMQVLTYMALVSKDKDDWPWFGQGQEALAEFALGRENPNRTDLRAVARAMGPLLDAGAVTVDRAGAARSDGNTTARYRLNLTDRADKCRSDWEETSDGKRRTSDRRRDPQHTTVSGQDIRRKVTQHTTVSDATYDGNRRTKEEEDQEERENRGIGVAPTTASHPSRADGLGDLAPVVQLFSKPPPAPPRRISRAEEAIAAATAARAQRRAEHQAQLAAEQSKGAQ